MLITAVFGDVHVSDVLFNRIQKHKWLYFLVAACLSVTSLIVLPIILITLAGWPHFPSVLLGVVSAIVVVKPLQKYIDLRRECKWFVAESEAQPKLF